MPSTSKTNCYKINPAIRLHWASWDDEYVVFDETSGQTHQLDSVRAFILNTLCNGASNSDTIVSELSQIAYLTENSDLPKLTEDILAELSTNGLLEAVNA